MPHQAVPSFKHRQDGPSKCPIVPDHSVAQAAQAPASKEALDSELRPLDSTAINGMPDSDRKKT